GFLTAPKNHCSPNKQVLKSSDLKKEEKNQICWLCPVRKVQGSPVNGQEKLTIQDLNL
ncbi:unnamed protein product, partial [Gulo gulo]